uniref:Uncharacterized protein n=1 Tax=Anguilla anguilla TaxID=7936 RepID=A0A0E9WAI6_ANGAN
MYFPFKHKQFTIIGEIILERYKYYFRATKSEQKMLLTGPKISL